MYDPEGLLSNMGLNWEIVFYFLGFLDSIFDPLMYSCFNGSAGIVVIYQENIMQLTSVCFLPTCCIVMGN